MNKAEGLFKDWLGLKFKNIGGKFVDSLSKLITSTEITDMTLELLET